MGAWRILGTFYTGIHTSWPSMESVIELMEARPSVEEAPGASPLQEDRPAVNLERVTFSYVPGGARILDDLSHTFESNRISAIVAPSGGGKSTILNLLLRLADPQAGTIRLGARELRSLTLESLRRRVFKVSQFPLFITGTVRDNFLLGNPQATDAEIEAVCRRVGLWEALRKAAGQGDPLDYRLPRPASDALNGGSLRRLAVARGMLSNPAILLIDEPTTGLDQLAKASLAQELKASCQGMTVLLVDHDMEFVSHVADQICCLAEGRFVQVGAPEDLASSPGLFQDLLTAWEQREDEAPQDIATPAGSSPGLRPALGLPVARRL
jgi:ATP-binding cassette subfamily B protein